MEAADTVNSIGFNIHLLSFSFPEYLIKHDVRVIVTTYPETSKHEYLIKSRDILYPNILLDLNIPKDAKFILLFFQKKCCFTKDPIIAWTVIETEHFPQNPQYYDFSESGIIRSEIKKINIYEYYMTINENGKHQEFECTESSLQRIKKINGQIEVQFTMTEPYILKESKHSKSLKSKGKDKSNKIKNNNYKNNNDEFTSMKYNENAQEDQKYDGYDESYNQTKLTKSNKKMHRKSRNLNNSYISLE